MERTTFDNFVSGAAGLVGAGTALYMAPVVTPPAIVSAVFVGSMIHVIADPELSTDPKEYINYIEQTYDDEDETRTKLIDEADGYSKDLEKNPKAARAMWFVSAVALCVFGTVLLTAFFQAGMNFALRGSATLFGGLAITVIGGVLASQRRAFGKPLLAAGLVLTSMIALPMLGYTIPGFTLAAGSSFALPYKAAAWGGAVGVVAAAALYLVRDVFFAQNNRQPLNIDVQYVEKEA